MTFKVLMVCYQTAMNKKILSVTESIIYLGAMAYVAVIKYVPQISS
jgi:hypothetical protein